MEEALENARRGNHDMLWLGVWPQNKVAIKFYEKYGFKTIGKHEFSVGDQVDIDAIMAKDMSVNT